MVGGLCWCITSSGAAVDVDIFYDDDLALGAKIQLSENIVKVLRTMGCPSPLQAHQIQGGDYVAIFPIVRWLVTKVLEYRRVTGDYVRMSSESAFDRAYAPFAASDAGATVSPAALSSVLKALHASDADANAAASISTVLATLRSETERAGDAFAGEVDARYRPTRKYRRGAQQWRSNMSAEARIQSALLEFGERTVIKASVNEEESAADSAAAKAAARSGTDFERKFAAMQRAAKAEEEEKRKAAVELERSMMAQMSEAKAAVSGSNVGALVGLQADELRKAADEYRAKEEELRALAESGDLMGNTKAGRAAAHARRVGALQTKLTGVQQEVTEARSALESVEADLNTLREALTKAEKYNNKARSEIAKLDATVAALPAPQQAQVRALFESYTRAEGLKDAEKAFKQNCKEQLRELQEMLAAMKAENASGPQAAQVVELERLHAEATARYTRAKTVMAERSREIAALARQLDDIPSRAELVQYERRFLELFDQVRDAFLSVPAHLSFLRCVLATHAILINVNRSFHLQVGEKLDETRKYYTVYNTLDKKRQFLSKEDTLISSMLENFAPAMKNKTGRQAFLDQSAAVVASLEDTLAKQRGQADAKAALRDGKMSEVQKLVEAQRAYYRAVKELQDEAEKSERIAAAQQQ